MPRKKKEEAAGKSRKAPAKKKTPRSKAAPVKTPSATPKRKKAPKAVSAVKTSRTKKSKPALDSSTPNPPSLSTSAHHKLPKFGATQVIAFVRDPQCIYTYWEVAPEKVEALKRHLKDEFKGSSLVLRVFRTNAEGLSEFLYEVQVEPTSVNRYLEVSGDGHSFFVEVGQKTSAGRYYPYARSRALTLPRGGVSPVVDPKWAPSVPLEDYYLEEVPSPSMTTEAVFSTRGQKSSWVKKKRPIGTGLSSHR